MLVQLSDLHLSTDPRRHFHAVDPWESLESVLAHVEERLASVELAIFSGDLAEDRKRSTYEALRERLAPFVDRCRFLPGNHDDPALIRSVFPAPEALTPSSTSFVERLGGWSLVGLDTHVPGKAHGAVDAEQLRALRAVLNDDRPVVLFLHHPPIKIGCAWLDFTRLKEPHELAREMVGRERVRLICHGHTHQEVTGSFHGIEVVGTPSTSVQFRPRSLFPRLDRARSPGFRCLTLKEDRVESVVVRV